MIVDPYMVITVCHTLLQVFYNIVIYKWCAATTATSLVNSWGADAKPNGETAY